MQPAESQWATSHTVQLRHILDTSHNPVHACRAVLGTIVLNTSVWTPHVLPCTEKWMGRPSTLKHKQWDYTTSCMYVLAFKGHTASIQLDQAQNAESPQDAKVMLDNFPAKGNKVERPASLWIKLGRMLVSQPGTASKEPIFADEGSAKKSQTDSGHCSPKRWRTSGRQYHWQYHWPFRNL